MKIYLTLFIICFNPIFSIAQFGQLSQVSIPVFFGLNDPSQQSVGMKSMGELSGIALMLFEKENLEDNIQMREVGDPILWMEEVGISKKATFIFPGNVTNEKIEILLSNGRITVKFIEDKDEIAWGVIAKERTKFVMRLVGDLENEGFFGPKPQAFLVRSINEFFMTFLN